jgi:hypothetical protein
MTHVTDMARPGDFSVPGLFFLSRFKAA